MFLAFETHILTSLNELHQQQKIITASLQKIMRRLKQSTDDIELPSHIKLPISEMEGIDNVEVALKNDQTRKILVSCGQN